MQDECNNGKNQKNKLLAFALTDAKWIDQFMLRDSSRGRIGSSGRRMSAHECFLQLLFASAREEKASSLLIRLLIGRATERAGWMVLAPKRI
jgi:hypothetical protein